MGRTLVMADLIGNASFLRSALKYLPYKIPGKHVIIAFLLDLDRLLQGKLLRAGDYATREERADSLSKNVKALLQKMRAYARRTDVPKSECLVLQSLRQAVLKRTPVRSYASIDGCDDSQNSEMGTEEGDDENYAWESDVDTYNWDPAEAAHESWDSAEAALASWDSEEAARAPESWDAPDAAHAPESWDSAEAALASWDSTEAARAPESWDSTEAAHAPESWDAAEAALASWDSEEAARAPTSAPLLVGKPVPPDEALDFEDQKKLLVLQKKLLVLQKVYQPTSAPLLVGKPVPPDEALDFEDQLVCDSQAWGSGGWDGGASPQDETLRLVEMPTPSRDAPRVKRPRLSWRRECEQEDEAWGGPPRFPLCGWAARNADKTNTYCYDPILDNEATKDTRKKKKHCKICKWCGGART
jgi:hypothetical protein